MLEVQYWLERKEKAATIRSTFNSVFDECARYALPRKATFISKTQTPGHQRNEKQFDSTAQEALEEFASALHSMLVNPGGGWFKMESTDDDLNDNVEVMKWFDRVTELMEAEIHYDDAGFSSELDEFFTDIGAVGTSIMWVDEPNSRADAMRFTAVTIDEAWVEENAHGRVDTIYTESEMTAKQVMEEYKDDEPIHESIQKAAKEEPGKKFKVLRVVAPRLEYDPRYDDNKNMPFGSWHIDVTNRRYLRESGFKEFPAMVARWRKRGKEVYGNSPTMKALPDIRMVNAMSAGLITAIEKALDPPLMLPSNTFLGRIKTYPGAINFYNPIAPGQNVGPLVDVGNIPLSDNELEKRRAAIRAAYFLDKLYMPHDPRMTAYQASQIRAQNLRTVSPMLGRVQTEFCSPFLRRVFFIMLRRGDFNPIPDVVLRGGLRIRYLSELAIAQKSSDADAIMATIDGLSILAQFDTQVIDNFDFDSASKILARSRGFPPESFNLEEAVIQIRNKRAEQAQQQSEMAQQQHNASMNEMNARAASQQTQQGLVR